MNSIISPSQSTLIDFYQAKSEEPIETPNELKKILVLRDVNGVKQLAIIRKKHLSFLEKLLAKLGFGSAAFKNVTDFINQKFGVIPAEVYKYDQENVEKVIEATKFLNEKIIAYKAAHSWNLLPFKGNPQKINLVVLEDADPIREKPDPTQEESNLFQDDSIQDDPVQKEPNSVKNDSVQEAPLPDSESFETLTIETLPISSPNHPQSVDSILDINATSMSSTEKPKESLILHRFSSEEFEKLESASNFHYAPLISAKEQMNYNPTSIPEPLKPINERLVQEFRFALEIDPYTDEEALTTQCHRSWGTNLNTLVELHGINACYPANRIEFENRAYIQAEAPRNEVMDSKAHYYQMAVESGANLLITASTGFMRIESKGNWTITPHRETMDFLVPGESVEVHGPNGCLHRIECESEEQIVELPENIKAQANIDGPCHYHIRRLNVTNHEDGSPRMIYQVVPDFVPVGLPFSLSQHTVDFVNQLIRANNIVVDKDHPVIVNCNTGRDRSGQFIILDSMREEIEELAQSMPIEEIVSQLDVVDQLRARAFMLAEQSTEGAGVDSIEKTLLPCFNGQIPVDQRKLYPALSGEERNELHQTINASYQEWALKEFRAVD